MDTYEETTTREYWHQIRAEGGEEGVRRKVKELDEAGRYRASVSAALEAETKEFRALESIDRPVRQEAREVASLDLAQKAHRLSWVAIGISGLAVVVSIVIAVATN